jgi:predicted nucleic acid-binding protein
VNTTAGLIAGAIDTAAKESLSLWDALIFEAAASAGCDRLLTEDLQPDRVIRGVRVENPFR